VEEIVDFHGGRIEVVEAAGGGACFRVTLRLAPVL
jgi:signal transduction histidine kinase